MRGNKKNMMNIKAFRFYLWGMMCYASVLLSGCNQDFPNLLGTFEQAGEPQAVKDKVLVIVADGLRGEALQDIEPPFFYLMQRNSLYTYHSLTDYGSYEVTKESAWASLMTGVYAEKHGVEDDDLSGLDQDTYGTVFQYVGDSEDRSSAFFGTSDALVTMFAHEAGQSGVFASDAELTDHVVSQMDAIDEDLIILQFGDVNKAGIQHSFESTDADYRQAILDFDAQVERIIDAMHERPESGTENWLVIVTSTVGGDIEEIADDVTVYGDANRNTFTFFYSPRFSSSYMNKPVYTDIPFEGNSINFRHAENVSVRAANAGMFNFEADEDLTIQFFFRDLNPNQGLYYPTIMTKRAAPLFNNGSSHGWVIFRENGFWGINSSAIDGSQAFGAVINDGNWHALTVVFDRANSTVYAYTNGQLGTPHGNGSVRALNANPLSVNVPFQIGRSPEETYSNANLNYTISNLQFYNKAFTEEEVGELFGIVRVGEEHPFYDNLIAYYPGYNDVGTNRLTDVTGQHSSLQITGRSEWYNFSQLVPGFQPPVESSFFRLVPNTVDISFMIYQWMGIRVNQEWSLDGKSWSPNYSQIRN